MQTHIETPGAFDAATVDRIQEAILSSPHMMENNLTAGFAGVRGFSLVFRSGSVDRVKADFPAFTPYLDQVLSNGCNAFYLNALVLGATASVGLHIDRSLYPYCETCGTPRYVSVLYVSVPDPMTGGVFLLRAGPGEIVRVKPERTKLLRFRGELPHQVTTVARGTEGLRVSLVCEQYDLDEAQLSSIPELWLEVAGRPYEGLPPSDL